MSKSKSDTTCFVISPIGAKDSPERTRADQVLKHIIAPAAEECGYKAIRADRISEPGLITSQVINHLLNDGLVIADLTGRNPNVFYELAVRHMVRKPVVQIIEEGDVIPFDVAQSRTIHVDHRDLDSAARCREELVKQIRASEADPLDVDTPISVAVDLQSLRQSENPLEKSNAEMMSMLQEIRLSVRRLPRELMSVGAAAPYEIIDPMQFAYDRLRVAEAQGPDSCAPEMRESLVSALEALEYALRYVSPSGDVPSSSRRRRPLKKSD